MKNLFFAFLLLGQLVAGQSKTTILYFIRHAEKIDNSKNPDLSDLGKIRAEHWKTVFEVVSFDAIYVTDFKRTMQTALPIANSRNIIPKSYNPKTIDCKQFLKNNYGKTVLIVGHSNSTPEFVNKIINKNSYDIIADTLFGNLYIVTLHNKKVVSNQLLKL